ncbi:hypothetical protein N0V83_010654, partial [Neocucurbitaria cava]
TVAETGQIQAVLPSRFNTYKHRPLSPGCIRVMLLLPGLEKDQISIELIEAPLETLKDQYEALSYMWGNPDGYKDYRPIYCGTQTINVTPNLYDALIALRLKFLRRMLWIDQITINQLNDAEKSEQVQMMGRIYANAEKVWVWLSKSIYEDLTCKTKLAEFCDYAQSTIIIKAVKLTGHDLSSGDRNEITKAAENFPNPDVWDNVCTVICCGYMRRVWMIQEIVRAKRASALISKSSFEWDKIMTAGSFLQFGLDSLPSKGFARQLLAMSGDVRKHTRALNQMAVIDRRLKCGGLKGQPKWALLDLVRKTAVMQATDPRDKIFAVAGLLDSGSECIATSIVPNYSKDVTSQDLLRQVIVEGLEQGSMTTLLTISPETSELIPSWMGPQASNFAQENPLIDIALNFDAGRDDANVRQINGEPNILSFKITPIGYITALYDPYPGARSSLKSNENPDLFFSTYSQEEEQFGGHSYAVFIDYYLRCADFYQENAGVEWSACREDFIRTFSMDHNVNRQRITGSERWRTSKPGGETIQGHINKLGELFGESDNPEQQWEENYVEAHTILNRVKDFRFACLTVDNDICNTNHSAPSMSRKSRIINGQRVVMCWLPVLSEVGDIVCVVHGLALPMLIRRKCNSLDRFRFLALCYVHEFMDGEALSSGTFEAQHVLFS